VYPFVAAAGRAIAGAVGLRGAAAGVAGGIGGRGATGFIARQIIGRALRSSGGVYWPGGELEAKITAKMGWNGPHYVAAVNTTSLHMLDLAMIHIVNEMKTVVSVPNPSGDSPSLPGEPPRKVSGDLQAGLGYHINRGAMRAYITVNGPAKEYWRHLEYGTRKMAPRPYIKITLDRVAPALAARIGVPSSGAQFTMLNFWGY
jgi:hypothetical protein